MRRKDREITDITRINGIILDCDCCRLALVDKNAPYIVPLNFGYQHEQGKSTFFFHGAKEGRKLELITQNPHAGFELDTNHAVHSGDIACAYSFRFRSVIGTGKVSMVEDAKEKVAALESIMRHYSDKGEWTFSDAHLNAVAVFKLEVDEMACKEHL